MTQSQGKQVLFVETTIFTELITGLATDDEFAAFQVDLAEHPDAGPIMAGCGGVRKVRMAIGNRGKSGGARILYLYIPNHERIYLLYIFTRGDADNLSPEGKRAMRERAQAIKNSLHA